MPRVARPIQGTAAAVLCIVHCPPLSAQDDLPVPEPVIDAGEATPETQSLPVSPEQSPACSQSISVIPKLTPVALSIDAELGSKISKYGDIFPIHLTAPLIVDGCKLFPAGTEGQGEVVHAKKASGSGTPGELVLAARFLQSGDVKLKLRSIHIAVAGEEAIKQVDTLNAVGAGVSVLAPVPLGLLGFGITGKNIVLPKGTLAVAKTAEDFQVAPIETAQAEQGIENGGKHNEQGD